MRHRREELNPRPPVWRPALCQLSYAYETCWTIATTVPERHGFCLRRVPSYQMWSLSGLNVEPHRSPRSGVVAHRPLRPLVHLFQLSGPVGNQAGRRHRSTDCKQVQHPATELGWISIRHEYFFRVGTPPNSNIPTPPKWGNTGFTNYDPLGLAC